MCGRRVSRVSSRGPSALIIFVVLALSGCGASLLPQQVAKTPPAPPRLVAALAPWQLPSPISRAVVLAQRNHLVVAGGLEANGQSASGIFRIGVSTGTISLLGALPQPVHDAAGAMLSSRVFVFGGGTSSSTKVVQSLTPGSSGQVVSQLPGPRSDLTSVVSGDHVFLLGGYDGATLAPAVLSTTDGLHFRRVATLALSVRYPAAAALGGRLFVFGGLHGSVDTTAIQEVNVKTRQVRVVGHLPSTLSHATALVLGHVIYILGGRIGSTVTRQMWSFDPLTDRVTPAGLLPMALADAGGAKIGRTAYLVGGEDANGPQSAVVTLRSARSDSNDTSFPFSGRLLIADRGNNRLLLVNAAKRILWTYPSSKAPAPHGGFYFPDDAFFTNRGASIIVNEEQNEVIVQMAFPSGKLLWTYGHAGVPGSQAGYLHEPDDAYLLKTGQVTVADAQNCRVLFLRPDGSIAHQIGTTGVCAHQPPTTLGSPNGDTPLQNGNVLISEINGSWVSEYTPSGQMIWTVHLPIAYPSDPQQIGPNRYLVADYSTPGALYEFNRSGTILWSYRITSGIGMLDHPSLAEVLPNGLIVVTDDYRDRIVVINPVTKSVVWQYGQTGLSGTRSGLLNTPDGFDLLSPHGQTPLHPSTG